MCGHKTCKECFEGNLSYLSQTAFNASRILCPIVTCGRQLSNKEIQSNVSREKYEQYYRLCQNVAEAKDHNKKPCPTPNCDSLIDITKVFGAKVDCPKC